MSNLSSAVDELVREFDLPQNRIAEIVQAFAEQGRRGLSNPTERGLPMIPTYITRVPTGNEKGVYLASDLGGTNFRVCSVTLLGNHEFKILREKTPVPNEVMKGTKKHLFEFLATAVAAFIEKHHNEHFASNKGVLEMGFTFSFPVDQTAVNKGRLVRWTKGFNIPDAIGCDVCEEFQTALDAKNARVCLAALVNDTVGSLMARSYTNDSDAETVAGIILGTGTNGAYMERLENCEKLKNVKLKGAEFMSINTEWGSFDNDLTVLPNTRFDIAVDANTTNQRFHLFEKRVSGMYVGELLRIVLKELKDKGLIFRGPALAEPMTLEALETPWSTDTSVPSRMELDSSADLNDTDALIMEHFGYNTSPEERKQVVRVAHAIAKRAGYLAGAACAGLLLLNGALDQYKNIDFGCDGSLYQHYPHFEDHMRAALRMSFVGDRESRITIGLAKDGSGVGAALCALMADNEV